MEAVRDELEVLARATDVLLQNLAPREMASRFLEFATGVFGADAALLRQGRPFGRPMDAAHGIPQADATRLADAMLTALRTRSSGCRAWLNTARMASTVGWRGILAARLGRSDDDDGVLALFASRPDAFDPRKDCRLLRLTARHLAVALDNASLLAETRRLAEQLAVQTEELERVHAALERHSRELEQSLSARSRFFAAVSHELRTPINAVLGYNQLLRGSVYGALTDPQRDVLDKITAAADQMLTVVNDILEASKLDAGHLEIRRDSCELESVIAEAIAAIEPRARAKQLEIAVELPPSVPRIRSDGNRVRQILLNLLTNAVKFTPHGSVTVHVRHLASPPAERGPSGQDLPTCAPGADGWIAISVRDTGIGIPPDKLDTVFAEFVQLARPADGIDAEGTGLGLTISNRLARLLGGELRVESDVGVQTTFTLILPCPAPPAKPTAIVP